jgi:hypothetical protein
MKTYDIVYADGIRGCQRHYDDAAIVKAAEANKGTRWAFRRVTREDGSLVWEDALLANV